MASEHRIPNAGLFQFTIRSLLCLTTVVAVFVLLTISVGYFPLVGLLGAICVGSLTGLVIGLCYSDVRSAMLAAPLGAAFVVAGVVIWYLNEAARLGEFESVRKMPPDGFLHPEVVISILSAAALGAIPLAAVAAVHRRRYYEMLIWPPLTCSVIVFLIGICWFGYDLWCRGEFPNSPIPWPIAVAIPLVAGTITAAVVGLISGAMWLGVRFTWAYLMRRGTKN